MFARRPDATPAAAVAVVVDGVTVEAREGDSVAAALLAAGVVAFRAGAIDGAPRGPWCLMGACFECVVDVDGVPGQRACMVRVAPGMTIATGLAARPTGRPSGEAAT